MQFKLAGPSQMFVERGMIAWLGASVGLVIGLLYAGRPAMDTILTIVGGGAGASVAILGTLWTERSKQRQRCNEERDQLRAACMFTSKQLNALAPKFDAAGDRAAQQQIITLEASAIDVTRWTLEVAMKSGIALTFKEQASIASTAAAISEAQDLLKSALRAFLEGQAAGRPQGALDTCWGSVLAMRPLMRSLHTRIGVLHTELSITE